MRVAAEFYRGALVCWVDVARRLALVVVLAALLVTAVLGYYTVTSLGLNASTNDMISPEVPFQRIYHDYQRALPQLTNNIAVVITGDSPDLADDAADALSARLQREPGLFSDFFWPGGSPFFEQNGLLYLDLDQLYTLTDRLAAAQPMLAELAADQSLRGLFSVLEQAVDGIGDEDVYVPLDVLGDVFNAIAQTVEAQLAGRFHQLSWQRLIMDEADEDGPHHRVLLVKPKLEFGSLRPAKPALDKIRSLARELSLEPSRGVRVRLTGGLALDDEELQSATTGAARAGLVSLALVFVLLFFGMGSPRLVLAVIVTLLFGLVWSAAFATFAVGHLNLISVAFAVLFIGLGVDFGIHFALRYDEERKAGHRHAEALRHAAAGVGGALSLCAVSAAIGFYAFVPTDFAGLAELGLISGTSMLVALFANLTLLPAILTLFRPRTTETERWRGLLSGSTRYFERYARRIPIVAFVFGLVGLALVPFARFDFDPLNLKDPNTESVATLHDLMADTDRPLYTAGVLAADLDQAVALAERLESLALVDDAITLADYVPAEQDDKLEIIEETALFFWPVFHGSDAAAPLDAGARRMALSAFRRKLEGFHARTATVDLQPPGDRLANALARFESTVGQSARSLEELEMRLLGALPARLEKLRLALSAEPVTLADLPQDLRARTIASDGRALIEAVPVEDIRDVEALTRFVSAVRAVAPEATDDPVVFFESGRAIVDAVIKAAVLALVAIVLLLLGLLRSFADTMLVLLPLVLTAVLTTATTVVIDLPFNYANVIVLPLLLGLGVANGIHLVMRRRGSKSGGAGVLRTSTPRAVLFSALTTICSFGSLALSSHPGSASLGLLLMIAVGLILVSTLVVLPSLLARFDDRASPSL